MLRALLLGDAACVHEDAAAALAMFTPDAVACTNNIGLHWPGRVDYWFTLHADPCRDWLGIEQAARQRVRAGRNRPELWGYKEHRAVDRHTGDWGGSTGLFAVKALREEGFGRIVLAGVPMTAEAGHFYDQVEWKAAPNFHRGWLKHKQIIAPDIRSMSGWTRTEFGPPTPEWLGLSPPAMQASATETKEGTDGP